MNRRSFLTVLGALSALPFIPASLGRAEPQQSVSSVGKVVDLKISDGTKYIGLATVPMEPDPDAWGYKSVQFNYDLTAPGAMTITEYAIFDASDARLIKREFFDPPIYLTDGDKLSLTDLKVGMNFE